MFRKRNARTPEPQPTADLTWEESATLVTYAHNQRDISADTRRPTMRPMAHA